MSDPLVANAEPLAKRRKVRKGTRSCWECRRRKIKCQFDAAEDAVCIGCKHRATACRSQEFADDKNTEPGQRSDPPLARRLDRLEQMMERLVDKMVPDEAQAPASSSVQKETRRSVSKSPDGDVSVDMRDTSTASEGLITAIPPLTREAAPRREPSQHEASDSSSSPSGATKRTARDTPSGGTSLVAAGRDMVPAHDQHVWVCELLRRDLPPQTALEAIAAVSSGPLHLAARLCYSEAEIQEGRSRSAMYLATVWPANVHPLLLARTALQALVCLQQLPSSFDWDGLDTGASRSRTMSRLATTSKLVTSSDDLVGYAEGIECLLLQAWFEANGGNLRKAWVTARRTLGVAQMMGIDQGRSAAFRSCNPNEDPSSRTSPRVLWSRTVYWERQLSVLLGLSIASQGIELPLDGLTHAANCPLDFLEHAHATVSSRLAARNASLRRDPSHHLSIYALTQEIDLELEAAAKCMPPGWWEEPPLEPGQEVWRSATRFQAQIQHLTLVLLVHVPHMLRDLGSPLYDYSKATCVKAARDLLSRFIAFRTQSMGTWTCRREDYSGLIAAMTLCLSYLGKRGTEVWKEARLRQDIVLVEEARTTVAEVGRGIKEPLSEEVARIMEQLVPIIKKAVASLDAVGVCDTDASPRSPGAPLPGSQFSVTFMGSVSIKLDTIETPHTPPKSWRGSHRRHPSSATGALGRMALGSPPQQDDALGSDPDAVSQIGCVHFVPYHDDAWAGAAPDFIANGEDWALQGVDAAYWGLFEGTFI